jgi:hypothetical protein
MSIRMSSFRELYGYDAPSFVETVFGDSRVLGGKDWVEESQRILCWTTERGGGESVVTELKQLCFFLKLFAETLNDDHNNEEK